MELTVQMQGRKALETGWEQWTLAAASRLASQIYWGWLTLVGCLVQVHEKMTQFVSPLD